MGYQGWRQDKISVVNGERRSDIRTFSWDDERRKGEMSDAKFSP